MGCRERKGKGREGKGKKGKETRRKGKIKQRLNDFALYISTVDEVIGAS